MIRPLVRKPGEDFDAFRERQKQAQLEQRQQLEKAMKEKKAAEEAKAAAGAGATVKVMSWKGGHKMPPDNDPCFKMINDFI